MEDSHLFLVPIEYDFPKITNAKSRLNSTKISEFTANKSVLVARNKFRCLTLAQNEQTQHGPIFLRISSYHSISIYDASKQIVFYRVYICIITFVHWGKCFCACIQKVFTLNTTQKKKREKSKKEVIIFLFR